MRQSRSVQPMPPVGGERSLLRRNERVSQEQGVRNLADRKIAQQVMAAKAVHARTAPFEGIRREFGH